MEMKKLNVYLDTSVINFLFADDAPEKKKFTEDFFNDYVAKGKFNTYISDVVLDEINKTTNIEKRNMLLDAVEAYPLEYLDLNDESIKLSHKYIEDNIIPAKKREDAMHLAIATINEIDVLVSWNFKHLANVNKEKLVIITNLKEGYNYPLRLTTPLEVMD